MRAADGAHFRKRPSNARARRPRDARERRIVASVVVVFKAKVVVVSPWKPPCSKVVSRCVFVKWRLRKFVLVRLVFFFRKSTEKRQRDRERERDERRERRDTNTRRAKKHHPAALFFINFETLKSNALEIFFLKERERERDVITS